LIFVEVGAAVLFYGAIIFTIAHFIHKYW
jgi:hypothetical protein